MVDRPLVFNARNRAPPVVVVRALDTRLALYQHHRDPMAWEQLFAGVQGLGLISSKKPWRASLAPTAAASPTRTELLKLPGPTTPDRRRQQER